MKKLHIVLLVASFIIPSISFASIDTNLKYGSRGVAVTELQDFLIAKGFLSGQTSGNFFSLTRKAVIAYQASVGLPATGYVGPMTRSKINDDLSIANAPAVSAEITETGTTTPTQANPLTPLISGCSSTTGFSTTTGTSCSGVTTNATPTVNRTMTLQNGSVVEVDANGSITRFVSSAITTPSVQSTAPTTSGSAESNSSLSISVGQAIATTTSAYLSWSTSIPTNSKLFLTRTPVDLYANSTQIISSASGYSTQHFVNISNLIPNTQYSYTIEAINGTLDQKITGTINTNALPAANNSDSQIADMNTNLLSLAKSFASSSCPIKPIIVVQPQQNSTNYVVVSISGDTITWKASDAGADIGFDIYDPCVSPDSLTWSYSSPMVNITANPINGVVSTVTDQPGKSWQLGSTSNYFNKGEGVAEAGFKLVAGTYNVTISASDGNGNSSTKTITNIVQ